MNKRSVVFLGLVGDCVKRMVSRAVAANVEHALAAFETSYLEKSKLRKVDELAHILGIERK